MTEKGNQNNSPSRTGFIRSRAAGPSRTDFIRVPQEKNQRERIHLLAVQYAADKKLVPPMSLNELSIHARAILEAETIAPQYLDFTMVSLGNAVWRETMASIPYNKRVLLLPQCLRQKVLCPAQLDEFGLLCEQCGNCATGDLMEEAENLGYVVLVAEGTTVVTKLLQSGQVDAVIGVSCLSTLERSFPYMTAAAIPGIAVPLFNEGCDNTSLDLDYLKEIIRLKSDETWDGNINIEQMRSHVSSWFDRKNLDAVLQLNDTATESLSCEWMAEGGKRWRPFLATCVYKAVSGMDQDIPDTMKTLAIAVECFHKASLVHDDIEDDDSIRYGKATLHERQGVPVALNVGDLLVGEGYRLIAECDIPPDIKGRILTTAARGHRELCLGQGEELNWMRHPVPLSLEKVLEIFRRKTSPAFEVALNIGAICGGADEKVCAILKEFSDSLGIAYQIRDDIDDLHEHNEGGDIDAMRPSVLVTLALEHTGGFQVGISNAVRDIVQELKLEEKAWDLFQQYKEKAVASLSPLANSQLKSQLYKIVHKVLGTRPETTVREEHAVHQDVHQGGAVYFPAKERSLIAHVS